MAQLKLKKNEERRLLSGHQWIFSNEIEFMEGDPVNGEVVELFSFNNNFLGRGFYNKNSLITYRHLTGKDEEINKAFIFKRLSMANSLRKKIKPEKETYRMVNSESDFLPGLIIDKFENNFSFQIFSYGMNEFKDIIIELLKENFNAELIVEKNNNELRILEGLEKTEEIIFRKSEPETESFISSIDEINYNINLLKGQKTGFYLDQCESRILIRKYIKPEHKILDLFCNEGGFALNAAFAGAKDVTGVDSSEHSINTAIENSKLNNFGNIKFICRDVFEHINDLFQSKERYDLVILDPPSFTKSRKNIYPALKGYAELNYKAMRLLKPNSILCTFSCSYHISEKHFEEMLISSALEAKRKIQIIEFRNCSFDHSVLPQMPETKYLKGYFLRIL